MFLLVGFVCLLLLPLEVYCNGIALGMNSDDPVVFSENIVVFMNEDWNVTRSTTIVLYRHVLGYSNRTRYDFRKNFMEVFYKYFSYV